VIDMSIMQHNKTSREVTTTHMISSEVETIWIATEKKTTFHNREHPEQPPIQSMHRNLRMIVLMKVQYHIE
jgi:hypothetical protein